MPWHSLTSHRRCDVAAASLRRCRCFPASQQILQVCLKAANRMPGSKQHSSTKAAVQGSKAAKQNILVSGEVIKKPYSFIAINQFLCQILFFCEMK
ncbi:unnamed protein product [Musa acuminata subsp. malaccensis]|uniref:(wild Malaysian banana) hypothetical protein n=1 Tax=Musa acuminata subsp. malaccensis TaxID=214687 RepID=A0A804KSC8_MUSAM|nr:unnamed protein product [Musa acuminata subsp. malaccensis]